MRWFQRNLLKLAIVLAVLSFLAVFVALVPIAAAEAQLRVVTLAPSRAVDATPTVDATVTALQKEQLSRQVRQLDNWWLYWLYNGSTAFIAAFATVIVAVIGIFQWRGNQNAERRKELATQDKELRDRADAREKERIAQEKEAKDRQEAQNGGFCITPRNGALGFTEASPSSTSI